jgi:signal transduction histidine kinase
MAGCDSSIRLRQHLEAVASKAPRRAPYREIIADCQGIFADKSAWDEIRAAVTDLEHDSGAQGRMQRPDGSVIDYATVALPEGMTMLTFVDVTDSARIQRVLSERNEALEAADRLKSDFIQHVSYELRSPLTSIIGFAEMLSDETVGSLNPTQRDYMDHIASSSSSLLAIINDILDLATVDAGIMSLQLRDTDVAAVAASAVEGLRDRLSEQRITLEVVVPRTSGRFMWMNSASGRSSSTSYRTLSGSPMPVERCGWRVRGRRTGSCSPYPMTESAYRMTSCPPSSNRSRRMAGRAAGVAPDWGSPS